MPAKTIWINFQHGKKEGEREIKYSNFIKPKQQMGTD
jgi:hypothetical protein